MRIKSRRNLPVRFTFLIRIFLVFIVSSALLSIYGLNFEKKISNIYEEIDEINLEKKYLNRHKQMLSNFYANSTAQMLQYKDSYLLENKDIREINFCIKQWDILRTTTFYDVFFEDYVKVFSNQSFYDQVLFSKIEEDYETFSKWNKTYRKEKPCTKEVHRKFVDNHIKYLVNGSYKFIFNLDRVLNDLFQREEILYAKITTLSKKSSNIYLITFFILILTTTIIIIADVVTNRGNKKKS